MAQRKKRRTVRKGKSTARHKTRKPPKSARGRPAKRRIASATPSKRLAKAKLKPRAKKARKRVKVAEPPIIPAVETVVVDLVEESVAGVTEVTESRRRRCVCDPEQPEEGRSVPPESEEP